MTKRIRPLQQVTMTDIAKRVGVSQMTVSRVFSGRESSVAPKTVEKIKTTAKQMGYIHNNIARTLVGGDSSRMIAAIIPSMESRVFNDVLSGINKCAAAHDVGVVFGVTEYNIYTEEKLVADLLSWRPKGIIITGVEHTENTVNMIARNNVACVEIMDTDAPPIHSAIGISHSKSGQIMAHHLASQGYTRIAYIGGDNFMDYRGKKRQSGFVETLAEYGIECVSFIKQNTTSETMFGRIMTKSLLEQHPKIQAIFYYNDVLATGGMYHCLTHGIKIPDDLALAGFTNLPSVQALPYRLTTIQTPRYDMGYQSAKYVLTDPNSKIIKDMGLDLIVGETT